MTSATTAPGPGRRVGPVLSLALIVVALLAVTVVWAAGRPTAPAPPAGAACDTDVEEPLDPRSAVGLLPNAPEQAYATDPPTSGPHVNQPGLTGVAPAPIGRAVQVGLLKEGKVLVQHRDLDDETRRRLEALAGDLVVVAPNPELDRPVVATAWRHRLRCTAVDRAALDAFVFAHAGKPT